MIHTQDILPIPASLFPPDVQTDSCVFFDIETTGFSSDVTIVYLIGAILKEGKDWVFHQWFAQNELEEEAILHSFSITCTHCRQCVHFNGDRFDIPYVTAKFLEYQLPNPFLIIDSIDLFKRYKHLKKLFHMVRTTQKSFETLLEIPRRDQLDGGQLIPIYHQYLLHPESTDISLLLLHNREDVLGSVKLLVLDSILQLKEGHFVIEHLEVTEAKEDLFYCILTLRFPEPFIKEFSFGIPGTFYIIGQNRQCKVQITGYYGTLKHFFTDYRNYYYIKSEDMIIHKSVGAYVDKEDRVQAKASNCFAKSTGYFLPQDTVFFDPVFRKEYSEKQMYFECTQELFENTRQWIHYLTNNFFRKILK